MDQARSLRIRFVAIATGATAVALAVLCIAINVWNAHDTAKRLDEMIEVIYENDGVPTEGATEDPKLDGSFQLTPESPYETRYFAVRLNANGQVTYLDATHLASVDEDEMVDIAQEIADGDQAQGYVGYYRYRAFDQKNGGSFVVVMDCFGELQAIGNFRAISIVTCVICGLIVFALILPASKRVIAPVMESNEQQRRFVTDASHELKTPIAIIAANTDLMEALDGPTQWTQSTRAQTERLSKLVGELVELARADEPLDETARVAVDLTKLVNEALENFEPLAKTSDRTLVGTVNTDITVQGNPDELERLVNVLLDNAIKYSTEEATVHVTLWQHWRGVSHVAELAVENPSEELTAEDAAHLFDRFYRADASRSRKTGGYGIGLALARAICTKHNGSISARVTEGRVVITATLPVA